MQHNFSNFEYKKIPEKYIKNFVNKNTIIIMTSNLGSEYILDNDENKDELIAELMDSLNMYKEKQDGKLEQVQEGVSGNNKRV